ncbi:MAG TPA: cysteine desulfurase family protein [Clostridia bacterium]|nr:cysteine desulfurase family protein [Clostridia bacterium]
MEVYLDNSATTAPCSEAVEATQSTLRNCWGNPSSLYKRGLEAEKVLESSRKLVAKQLSCKSDEIYFTSGGTESNNLAIFGTVNALKRRGHRIVSTSIEHPSVEECLKYLEGLGFEVIRLTVDSEGRFSQKDLMAAVNSKTILVSLMLVNNEVGTIQPVEFARRAVNATGAPAYIHCDAVQAFGKTRLQVSDLDVDLISISSHKIHGPKGVGALYIRKGIRIEPRAFGGTQEKRIRPGTEPMPAIAGFGAAVKALPNPATEIHKISRLRDYLCYKLGLMDGITINSPKDSLPYITNISVNGINSEPMLNFLSDRGIYVSAGSACSKGKKSSVLKAMGLSDERISSALRISFSRMTTFEDIDVLLDGLSAVQSNIRPRR